MVFEEEAEFKQLVNCKFRENVVRVIYVPTVDEGNVFLVVNKYGSVGLYNPITFSLIFTYVLDLSGRNRTSCQKTHFVTDAIYAPDLQCIVFSTSKNILIFYDVGEIERQSIGLELLPNQECVDLGLKAGRAVVPLKNKGHVESHRLYGLLDIPYCLFYASAETVTVVDKSIEISQKIPSFLFVGDQSGSVSIFSFEDPKKIFNLKKIRGVRHELYFHNLENVKIYKAHRETVLDLVFIPQRQLLISCSKDRKCGLFIQDISDATDPSIVQFPKGVNTVAHSEALKLIATGSDDNLIRLLNQYSKGIQMELPGHKAPIIALQFSKVSFSDNPLLLSYSTNVELKAWDPVTFVCLQSVYITFPVRSTLVCKTPEFGKKPLIVFQPHYEIDEDEPEVVDEISKHFEKKGNKDGFLVVIYCNSYARLYIERDSSHWPFDFQDFVAELDEVTAEFERKMRLRKITESKDPKTVQLSTADIRDIESNIDIFIDERINRKRVSEIKGFKNSLKKSHGPLERPGDEEEANANFEKFIDEMMERKGRGEKFNTTIAEQAALAERALKKFHSLKLAEGIKRGGPFSFMPLHQLETIEFAQPSKLRMTNGMKKAFGQEKIPTAREFLGETARKYFDKYAKAIQDNPNTP